jgi:hypothetical protein
VRSGSIRISLLAGGLLVLLAAIGWFAWALLTPDALTNEFFPAPAPARRDEPAVAAPAPHPEVDGARIEEAPVEPAPGEPPPPAAATCRSRHSAARLRGRLVDLVSSSPWTTPVVVDPQYEATSESRRENRSEVKVRHRTRYRDFDEEPPNEAASRATRRSIAVAADGTFECGLDDLFSAARYDTTLVALELVADDPRYMPERRAVIVPNQLAATGGNLEVVIAVRVAALVSGRVDAVDRESGRPRDLSHALAALVPPLPTRDAPIDVAAAPGRYLLRSPRDGRFDVVLVADGCAPARLGVELAVGAERELPATTLDSQASIRGRITWPTLDVAATPYLYEAMNVTALLVEKGGTPLDVPGVPLTFDNGHLLRRSLTMTTAAPAGGHADFSLDGLAPGRSYRVALGDASLSVAGGVESTAKFVTAPADGVELAFDLAYVGVDVVAASAPLAGARVTMTSIPEAVTTDTQGRAGFLVPAGREGDLLVAAEGYQPARAWVLAGPAGTITRASARMVPAPVHAKLALELRCAALARVEWARLVFEPQVARIRVPFVREVACDEATARFDDLPEGTFKIRVDLLTGAPARKPGANAAKAAKPPKSHDERLCVRSIELLDPALEVELLRDPPCERSVTVELGGALRIAAHDAQRQALTATCTLKDAKGDDVDFLFIRDERRIEWNARGGPWCAREVGSCSYGGKALRGEIACQTSPALAPGRYAVTLAQEGYETTTIPFDVRAGETLDLDVLMPRKP